MDRRRWEQIALCLGFTVVVGLLSWAVLGGRGDESTGAATLTTSAAGAGSGAHGSANARAVVFESSVNTGDYVVVDQVNGPNQLVVHTTRGPGHDLTPYLVIVTPSTIVHPMADAAAQVVGTYEGVAPGDQFYFVGSMLSPSPGHRIVEAVRIFDGP